MATEVRLHRVLTVLLTAALLATLTVALTGGQRADAVDGPVEVVYVATGQNFPDALAGANLAATVGAPMLTVNPDLPIPDPTITALQALDPDQIIILGGPVAVSEPVADALTDYARSGTVTRIEGGDRHDTAAQIADALPSKVHDADKLDGLDASAFARASDLEPVTVTEHAVCAGTSFLLEVMPPAAEYGRAGHAGRWVGGVPDPADLHCQVQLPDRARITEVTFELGDLHPTGNVTWVRLQRISMAGTPQELLAERQNPTVGTPGAVTIDLPVASSPASLVDNGKYAYLLTVTMSPSSFSQPVSVTNAAVTYAIGR